MHKFDRLEYQLINDTITEFAQNQISLGELVESLRLLIDSLEEVSIDYKETVLSEWWTLEQIYAVSLDQDEKKLTPQSQNLVDEAIKNIQHIMDSIELAVSPFSLDKNYLRISDPKREVSIR